VSVDPADPYFIYGGTQDNAALFGRGNSILEEGHVNFFHVTLGQTQVFI